MDDADATVRSVALERVYDLGKLRDNNPAKLFDGTRQNLEGRIEAYEIVRRVAREHSDPSIRNTAASFAATLGYNFLFEVQHCSNADWGLKVVPALCEDRLLGAVATEGEHDSVRRSALEKVKDPFCLAQIAVSAEEMHIRTAAFERITDEKALMVAAAKSNIDSITQEALSKISGQEKFAEIAILAESSRKGGGDGAGPTHRSRVDCQGGDGGGIGKFPIRF